MPNGYSQDLRERFVAAVDSGMSHRGAGRLFTVSAATAVRWGSRWRKTGSVAAKPKTGHRISPLEAHADWLLGLVRDTVDLTLEEIRSRLSEREVTVAASSVWRFYERHKITFKKNHPRQRAGAGRRRQAPGGMGRGAAGP